jgi:hypothetical protein
VAVNLSAQAIGWYSGLTGGAGVVLALRTAIAKFLGTSPASAQGWAKQGMPVKRQGRFTIADPEEVQAW